MTNNKYFIYSLILLISVGIKAQELPPIKNFSGVDYNAGNQNWSISQADDKNIYIANNSGLLEYNGASWKLHPSVNGTILRSVKVINDLIYTGCYMEFGFWKRNDFGNLFYESLIDKLPKPLVEDEQFWKILEIESYVVFQSLSRIYLYNTEEKSFKIIDAPSARAEIFKVGKSIYYQKLNEGIFKIEKGNETLVSNHRIFKDNDLVGAFLVDKKNLFLTDKGEFYFLNNKTLVKWDVPASKELASASVYCSIQLKNGSFIVGTISDGVYHLDKEGSIIRSINQEKGLRNNTILSVYEDVEHSVWLGLENGVCVINLDSPFSIYNDLKGKIGAVYAATTFEDKLYIGTNQGLFYKNRDTASDFEFIENTKGIVWSLTVIDDVLFCGHNRGTFVIEDSKAKQISEFPGTWGVKKIKDREDLLLQGNYNGLSILEKNGENWIFKNKIEGFNISSRFFEFTGTDRVIVNHEYKGVYQLELNNEYTKVIAQTTQPPRGIESSIINYNNNLLYATANGIFSLDKKDGQFVKDFTLTRLIYSGSDAVKGNLISDEITNKLWGFSNENIVYITTGNINNKPTLYKIPIPAWFRRDISLAGFENLTAINEETFLIGTSNGYALVDLEYVPEYQYTIGINSIIKESLKTGSQQVSFHENGDFLFSENNVYFSYSVPSYDKYTEVNYQIRLDGIYDDWSDWSTKSETSFKNLPFGEYTLEVKAKIGNTLSENIANYSFVIQRPWYLSDTMIIVYIVLCVLLFMLVHLVYKQYYSRQKKRLLAKKERDFAMSKLESEKEIMKLRNDKLRHEIDSKSRELSVSTMSIIKKNELLNAIKKELKDSVGGDQIKPVIKIINKNLANSSDWEMFQEAFNNADSDFLKKIKSIHPNLTPNDLRLCAYLRLNLSSKEVAPLLNISPRSVEIKRYRLRKKMELAHEKSLVEYILEI